MVSYFTLYYRKIKSSRGRNYYFGPSFLWGTFPGKDPGLLRFLVDVQQVRIVSAMMSGWGAPCQHILKGLCLFVDSKKGRGGKEREKGTTCVAFVRVKVLGEQGECNREISDIWAGANDMSNVYDYVGWCVELMIA